MSKLGTEAARAPWGGGGLPSHRQCEGSKGDSKAALELQKARGRLVKKLRGAQAPSPAIKWPPPFICGAQLGMPGFNLATAS